MKLFNFIFSILLLFIIPLGDSLQAQPILSSQSSYFPQNNLHPRLLGTAKDVEKMRLKALSEPYLSMKNQILSEAIKSEAKLLQLDSIPSIKDCAEFAKKFAFAYSLDPQIKWAQLAWKASQKVASDTKYLPNPFFRGLDKGKVMLDMSLTYDLCYTIWTPEQRKTINDLLFQCIASMSISMGKDANLAIESNWVGVRYSSMLFTTLAWDAADSTDQKSLIWESSSRLRNHIEENILDHGWNAESISYFAFDFGHIFPAVLANHLKFKTAWSHPASFHPKIAPTFQALWMPISNIQTRYSRGVSPDLSDDDPMINPLYILPFYYTILPDSLLGQVKWLRETYYASKDLDTKANIWYTLLLEPKDLVSTKPLLPHNGVYVCETSGTWIKRNKIENDQDIITTFQATLIRKRGHQGPDVNSLRLQGLGNIWIVGGGRSKTPLGQSTFFPDSASIIRETKNLTKGSHFRYTKNSAEALGSNVGTIDHKRNVQVFDTIKDLSLAIILKDSSQNGETVRFSIPIWNHVMVYKNSVLITGPEGQSLKISYLNSESTIKINREQFKYGNKEDIHNFGILFRNRRYDEVWLIDFKTGPQAKLLLTLCSKNEKQPKEFSKWIQK